MTIEIINGDFEVFNNDLSVTISHDSLEQMFYGEYQTDIKNDDYRGEFRYWVLDYDKCFEYLNKFLTIK